MKRILIFTVLFILVSSQKTLLAQNTDKSNKDSIPFLSFDTMSASEFFDFIWRHPYLEQKVLTVYGKCEAGWVKEDDVHYLIPHIRSKIKVSCLNHVISSYWPDKGSELGGYALDLIMSYRYNTKFFEGLYQCTEGDASRADECEKWYHETFPEKTYKK
jgi:hypothetical protein